MAVPQTPVGAQSAAPGGGWSAAGDLHVDSMWQVGCVLVQPPIHACSWQRVFCLANSLRMTWAAGLAWQMSSMAAAAQAHDVEHDPFSISMLTSVESTLGWSPRQRSSAP